MKRCDPLAEKLVSGEGELHRYANSPFADFVTEWVALMVHDLQKAGEAKNGAIDEAMAAKINQLDAVAGGWDRGQYWWSSAADADMVKHFEKTLEKVAVEQITNLSQAVLDACERYAITRAPGPEQDSMLQRAAAAQLKARHF